MSISRRLDRASIAFTTFAGIHGTNNLMHSCIYTFSMKDGKRSMIMSKIRSSNTSPEIRMRRALWAIGLRYRLQYGREKIDIAFPGKKLAVFIDGCFWHSCPIHGHVPRSNIGYWKPKLEKNAERAAAKDARLQQAGWAVVHFWEHEVNSDAGGCARKIQAILSNAKKVGRS